MRHFQATIDHGEGQLALHQIERILAEHAHAPAFENRQILAHASSQQFQIVRAGQQAGGHVDLARADFQQQLEQIGHQRAFLAQRGAARGARGSSSSQRLGIVDGLHQALADLIVLPARREAAHLGQIGLRLGRMAGDIGQSLVAGDAAARDVLVLRFMLAPGGQSLQAPSMAGLRPAALIFSQALPASLRNWRIGQLSISASSHSPRPVLIRRCSILGKIFARWVTSPMAYSIWRSVSGRRLQSVKRALVDRQAQPRLDQIGIADLLALADGHHRDLRVENRVRGLAGQIVDDFHILPARVENLEDILIVHQQVEQRGRSSPGALGSMAAASLLSAIWIRQSSGQ
jgi:hypothetical protein